MRAGAVGLEYKADREAWRLGMEKRRPETFALPVAYITEEIEPAR